MFVSRLLYIFPKLLYSLGSPSYIIKHKLSYLSQSYSHSQFPLNHDRNMHLKIKIVNANAPEGTYYNISIFPKEMFDHIPISIDTGLRAVLIVDIM